MNDQEILSQFLTEHSYGLYSDCPRETMAQSEKILMDIAAEVVNKGDITKIAGIYFPLKKGSTLFSTHCPFHEDIFGLNIVFEDKQKFSCLGCGSEGNVIDLVMKKEMLSYPEAVCVLANILHIKVPKLITDNFIQINIADQWRKRFYTIKPQPHP